MLTYALRLFRHDFGDILEVVELFRKVSEHTIITEEMEPYQHYHLMIWSEKNLKQIKKFVSNHTPRREFRIRRRGNTDCELIQNEPAYRRYIQKDYVRGFDSITGWMCNSDDYKYDFEGIEPEAQHFWEEQQDKEVKSLRYNDILEMAKNIDYSLVN